MQYGLYTPTSSGFRANHSLVKALQRALIMHRSRGHGLSTVGVGAGLGGTVSEPQYDDIMHVSTCQIDIQCDKSTLPRGRLLPECVIFFKD